jgi:hypothetical protein
MSAKRIADLQLQHVEMVDLLLAAAPHSPNSSSIGSDALLKGSALVASDSEPTFSFRRRLVLR